MTDQDVTTSADGEPASPDRRTFMEGDGAIARRLARPVRNFLDIEAAGGLALLVATVAALVLANSPAGDSIASFWERDMTLLAVGDFDLTETIGDWINDGLMAIFFFVVGLEIKRELVTGELRDRRRAALPAIAAIGGMVVPAGLYLVLNAGGDGSRGWGVPMATDIAFAVGVLALLGDRVPSQLKVFLLTLAIVDDIGAIAVIAVFYTNDLSFGWLATAVIVLALMMAMRKMRIWYTPFYIVSAIVVWIATLESGVHATIAGVAIGLITPARALRPRAADYTIKQTTSWTKLRDTIFEAKEAMPVAQRLQHLFHPWSSFIILPLFAFANAGIELSADRIGDAVSSPVTLGVVLGLVIGKPLGILALSSLAVRSGVGSLPGGVQWRHIAGAGALAGIGFTVSIFITGLAFLDEAKLDEAKLGVLAASLVAAIIGVLLLTSRALPADRGIEPQRVPTATE